MKERRCRRELAVGAIDVGKDDGVVNRCSLIGRLRNVVL